MSIASGGCFWGIVDVTRVRSEIVMTDNDHQGDVWRSSDYGACARVPASRFDGEYHGGGAKTGAG